MFCFLCVAVVFIAFFVVLMRTEMDFTLAFYHYFGKKAKELSGQVVWITGASGGIGECLAYEFAKAGCKIVLSARREEELERVKIKCQEITNRCADDFLVLPIDVTKFDTHKDAFKTVLEHFNRVDILVNNSGRSQRGLAVDIDFEVDQSMFDVNVFGAISLTKVVLPHMIERKTGQIVIVNSLSGKFGTVSRTAYSATKFALQGYFDALRGEVFAHNIHITTVCPGPVKSDIINNAYVEKQHKIRKIANFHKPFATLASVLYQIYKLSPWLEFAYSIQHGTNKDKKPENVSRRMDTDKFAQAMVVGVVNKLGEIWISIAPEIYVVYAAQYLPSITQSISKRIAVKALAKMRSVNDAEKKDN